MNQINQMEPWFGEEEKKALAQYKVDLVYEWQCPGNQRLAEGKALRRQAIETSDDAMHGRANKKLEASASCGNPEASAQLRLAYCHGLGVRRDRLHGGQLIRFAYENGARLSPDWFLDPDFCPG